MEESTKANKCAGGFSLEMHFYKVIVLEISGLL